MLVEERAVTTPPLEQMKCGDCKHWIFKECFGHQFPYCDKIKSDSIIFRKAKCDDKYFEQRENENSL